MRSVNVEGSGIQVNLHQGGSGEYAKEPPHGNYHVIMVSFVVVSAANETARCHLNYLNCPRAKWSYSKIGQHKVYKLVDKEKVLRGAEDHESDFELVRPKKDRRRREELMASEAGDDKVGY
ncbi:hypothetical protein KSP40_PGU015042 [Platanthera guangdongensis]|uniref:Uncharacterized protein n=1 Tax=Platanthera guangdongensis TaxID=2320717 RepID=A0ABR2MCM2_9ASPA